MSPLEITEQTRDLAAQTISKYLMTMSKQEKYSVLKSRPDYILNRIFEIAKEREQYEVCEVIIEVRIKNNSN